jgi:hypothetical protein
MKPFMLILIGLALAVSPALAQDTCAPGKVTTLATVTYYGAIFVSWTATGDDCATGNATAYELRYSTSPIDDTHWQGSGVSVVSDLSAANGNQDTWCVDVNPCATTTYYFAVFLIDEAGNRSPISNVVTGHARCIAPFETCP